MPNQIGYTTFARDLGLPEVTWRLHDHLARLAELCGIDVRRLKRWSVRSESRRVFFGKIVATYPSTASPHRALCPLCIASDRQNAIAGAAVKFAGYVRWKWQFGYYFGCLRHGVALVTACPECTKQISACAKFIDRCSCGWDFARTRPTPLSTSATQMLRIIDDNLEGGFEARPTFDGPIGHASFEEQLDAINMVGSAAIGSTSSWSRIARRNLVPVFEEASLAFGNFPASFRQFLDRATAVGRAKSTTTISRSTSSSTRTMSSRQARSRTPTSSTRVRMPRPIRACSIAPLERTGRWPTGSGSAHQA